MIFIFFGPPGSGKGTQAQFLCETGNFIHVSTGDLLRDEINHDTILGRTVRQAMEKGDFPSDSIVIELVKTQILKSSTTQHLILDGFPRTLNQAVELDNMLKETPLSISCVVDFVIDTNKLVDRVSGRFSCAECGTVYHDIHHKPSKSGTCDKCLGKKFKRRVDDQPDVLKNRISKYLESTQPVKQYYMDARLLVEVDASRDPEEVRGSIIRILNKYGTAI